MNFKYCIAPVFVLSLAISNATFAEAYDGKEYRRNGGTDEHIIRKKKENRNREKYRNREENRNREEYKKGESKFNEKEDPTINRWWWPFSFFSE